MHRAVKMQNGGAGAEANGDPLVKRGVDAVH
jgi:hypothetical protein